jgi:hypothetical protein
MFKSPSGIVGWAKERSDVPLTGTFVMVGTLALYGVEPPHV